ncbi:hypothetical protein J671_1432 [Acinetobacter sp. 1130196]|nr:hypothetical protein J671_1432 [Acinetobacter sp. 1130196]EXR33128.1 hypothetical protein J689_1816 [Acinetobacter sp. 1179249]
MCDEITSFSISQGANFKKNCQPFHISIMLNIYSNAKLNQQKCIFPMNEKWLKQTT